MSIPPQGAVAIAAVLAQEQSQGTKRYQETSDFFEVTPLTFQPESGDEEVEDADLIREAGNLVADMASVANFYVRHHAFTQRENDAVETCLALVRTVLLSLDRQTGKKVRKLEKVMSDQLEPMLQWAVQEYCLGVPLRLKGSVAMRDASQALGHAYALSNLKLCFFDSLRPLRESLRQFGYFCHLEIEEAMERACETSRRSKRLYGPVMDAISDELGEE